MKLNDWLKSSEKLLEKAGIGTARLDALVLLEDVVEIDRARLLAEPERELTAAQTAKLEKLLKQRAKHVPLAYLRGKTEFYGREFVITPAVLEPRPESETMIDLLKQLCRPRPDRGSRQKKGDFGGLDPGLRWDDKKKAMSDIRIADVGAGSGALGITAQLELPEAQIDLIEIDPEAAKVAQINVDKYTMALPVIQADLLTQSQQNYDVLLCNLPYVPDDFQINSAAMREPRLAIFGGLDGLNVYRTLFSQVQNRATKPLYILTEALPPQHTALSAIALAHGYQLQQTDDFIQVFCKK